MDSAVPPTRVLCVDDNADVIKAMRLIIGAQPSLECVGCLESADHLIREVCSHHPQPDVIVLDATMPGREPIAAMRELTTAAPGVRTIIYSGYDDTEFINQAFNAGAWGCVSKREHPGVLLHAISEVAAGRVVFPDLGESSVKSSIL